MLDPQVISAVAIGNLKAISEQPGMLSNLAFSNVVSTNNLGQQNAVANQRAVGDLGVPLVAKATNTVSELSATEARAAVDVLTNDELAQTIADMKAVLAAFAGPGPGPGPKPRPDWWRGLQALIDRGLKLLTDGGLQVPPGTEIVVPVPANFRREHVRVSLDDKRVVIRVDPLLG